MAQFQFTHPGRGATYKRSQASEEQYGFNSRTPGGVRLCSLVIFQSRSWFQFTHPGRGATTLIKCTPYGTTCFNSRTPGGVRQHSKGRREQPAKFQFTHPGRGATSSATSAYTPTTSFNSRTPGGVRLIGRTTLLRREMGFNSRTPGGVRHLEVFAWRGRQRVSIHAPREGCDHKLVCTLCTVKTFQFTHPGRGATLLGGVFGYFGQVSIHAPREGCDAKFAGMDPCINSFNSRTPGGVRRKRTLQMLMLYVFQFTHPGRGATAT